MVRTNTLVKNSVVTIDATPFGSFVNQKYHGIHADKTKDEKTKEKVNLKWETAKTSKGVTDKHLKRRLRTSFNPKLIEQFNKGVLYACISSRPGQSGRCDGYILEGAELEFYLKKMQKKK